MTAEEVLLRLAIILAAGVGAQWLAWRLRLPSILLLLIAGFMLGPVSGFVDPEELFGDLLLPFISVAVAVILWGWPGPTRRASSSSARTSGRARSPACW